ncbi:hypothetical protein SGP16018_43000 [Shigella flexneri]|nr:hypothetical protein SGP16018_43000 [Shigella flexneri]GLG76765.1 hypothetical protein SGP16020_41970 [Shigella flexneri]
MVGNGFSHVPDVFCHALLKLNIIIKCVADCLFIGTVALQMVDAERFKQVLRQTFFQVVRQFRFFFFTNDLLVVTEVVNKNWPPS